MPPLPAYPRLFRLFLRLGSLGIPLLALLAFSLCPACFPRREQVRSFNKCLSDSEQGSDVAHALSLSQRSLHIAPIFRLLLKVAVNGTQQCDFINFCGAFWAPTEGVDSFRITYARSLSFGCLCEHKRGDADGRERGLAAHGLQLLQSARP